MKFFFTGLFMLIAASANAADVRFSNAGALGLNGFYLHPHNGNTIRVWDPRVPGWTTVALPPAVAPNWSISGVVSDCYINDIPHQSLPYNVIYFAYLKMDANGVLYINWLSAGSVEGPEGFRVDVVTATGHLVGMAIRRPGVEIQGQYNSELLVSWYNRGEASFFSIPAGSVSASQGWQPVGAPVELLIWEDEWPVIVAALTITGTAMGASMQAAIVPNGSIPAAAFGAATNLAPGKPHSVVITYPGAPVNPGFYTYQIYMQTDAGVVTLGAALNSSLNVHSKF